MKKVSIVLGMVAVVCVTIYLLKEKKEVPGNAVKNNRPDIMKKSLSDVTAHESIGDVKRNKDYQELETINNP